MIARVLLIIFLSLSVSGNLYAKNEKLPIPRFVSIKFNEVNARTGPGVKYPIEWVFTKKGEPVELINEYEQWREIKDIHGEGGWVHLSVLSGKRSVIITSKDLVDLHKNPDFASRITTKLSTDVRCIVNKCKNNWCQLKCQNFDGWLQPQYFWGVYKDEKF